NGSLESNLKQLNFKQSKIDMIKVRCSEMVNNLREAERKAKAFYKLQGLPDDTKFFLETEEDYAKLKGIDELSVDPGNTYLSIDNENYLYGVQEFTSKTSEADKLQALEKEKKKRKDPKRWDDQDYDKNQNDEAMMNKFLNNPLRGEIKAAPAA
ncbi:MAG: hypothetical protein IJT72_08430, partial [Lachnospiraceae bacterium]|nr:hypothetical protein [Lachnospiraceae bacterium]